MFWKPHFEFNTAPRIPRTGHQVGIRWIGRMSKFFTKVSRSQQGCCNLGTEQVEWKLCHGYARNIFQTNDYYIWKAWDIFVWKYAWLAYPMASNRHLIAMSRIDMIWYDTVFLSDIMSFSTYQENLFLGLIVCYLSIRPLQWRIEGLVGLW